MDHISDFLSRYLSPYLKREKIKEEIAKILSVSISTSINVSQISVQGNICTISGHQGLKHQIFIKKDKILEEFRKGVTTAHINAIQ